MSKSKRAVWAWRVTLLLYLGLITGLSLDHLLMRDDWHWVLWLTQTLPLLLVLPGLVKKQARSGIWLCFMLMFYFLLLVDDFFTGKSRAVYAALLFITVGLFVASMLFARWQVRGV